MSDESRLAAQIDLTITLQTALHIGTGLGLAQILDDRVVQGPHPDAPGAPLPYIPGSSLKGRLRYHARQLAGVLLAPEQRSRAEVRLFGLAESPGGLTFSDAHLADAALANSLAANDGALLPLLGRSERSFVGLSRERRVALNQRLFRLELADGELAFAARIGGWLPAAHARSDLGLLIAAMRDMTHLGGHKGRGLGACSCAIGAITLGAAAIEWQALLEELR